VSVEQRGTDFYVTGGTMAADADSYVRRPADDELLAAVERGEYCYVLTTRQMGKSSLMVRTARQLALNGTRSAQVSLETIRVSVPDPSPDPFLYGIASRVHRDLRLTANLRDWWREQDLLSPTQRFHDYLTEWLLDICSSPIVVFIDEIDSTIGLPFADDFFATIRACYNGRASNPALKRLTFVLLGVATPAQLIADPARTPFNIGKGIELDDFTMEQAGPLTRGFPGSEAERHALLERVLYWTGGHPYLTQTACRALAARLAGGREQAAASDQLGDAEVERLFLRPEAAREESNLKFVRSRLTQGTPDLRAVLLTYRRVLKGVSVEDKPASSIHASLKLAGVVRARPDGYLAVRNEIYRRVFGLDWVRREMPRNRARLVVSLSAAAVLLSAVFGGLQFQQARQAQSQLETIQARLREQDRVRAATLQELLRRAAANPFVWEPGTGVVDEQFLRQVGPDVFAEAPWQGPVLDPSRLLDVIERSHRLFVPSRDMFGAMSFAIEEVWLRNQSDARLRERARDLSETVRTAFLEYHEERTPGFKAPPATAAEDSLNDWVELEGGQFTMGSEVGLSYERPLRSVQVSAFSMQRHEVTNGEYARFDPGHRFEAGQELHPVVNVSWYEAVGYAAWLGASLPTEAQWEYAAAGTRGAGSSGRSRRYPWGNAEPTPDRAVFSAGSTQPVDPPREQGRTPEGIEDMAGNVWEWCRDWYGAYAPQSVSNPVGPIAMDSDSPLGPWRVRVLRGGSFSDFPILLRAAFRLRSLPDSRNDLVGFRLVSSRLRQP
jgi:formylglycine-generating enzyme required for sulfatase activity